ncbi:PIG-L deacetylase family protein [Paenibacillus sp. UNC451MF]|uniref:PIG-L deacetylase family protein n=1 Tax=Paenibacillus sp. UNC451MF TaxID=1449063 RepID=UPI00048AB690|nr:PIG-L family deacetylase [Paenibacillus sp. UNC451MF]
MSRTTAFIFAHPDDESFLCACLIKQLAEQGEKPVLLLATRGDAGKKNGDVGHLTNEELGAQREQEMMKAASILGLSQVEHLGYPDGKLKEIEEGEFIERVIHFILEHKPEVVVTFPEDGGNFHPDHMTISKIATSAVLSGRCPSVQKLYYISSNTLKENGHHPSIALDTEPYWSMKAEALHAHESQIYAIRRYFGDLESFPENRRYESFVLAWERGAWYPPRLEKSIYDGII